MDHYDVIIIGSGLGGLTCGAKLAGEGRKVLVCEQHHLAGGYATCFTRKGVTFEVGLQEIDGFDEGDIKSTIFDDLRLWDEVPLVKIPGDVNYCWSDAGGIASVQAGEGAGASLDALMRLFPEEKKGILRWQKTLLSIRRELLRLPLTLFPFLVRLPVFPLLYPHVTRYNFTTVGSLLDCLIKNDGLKQILLGNLFYFHDNAYELSLLYFAAGQGGYLKNRYYIRGGSQTLSDALVRRIKAKGGELLLNSAVVKILTDKGRVKGVVYKKGNEECTAISSVVVANSSPLNLSSMLDTLTLRKRGAQTFEGKTLSPSFTEISMVLKKGALPEGYYKTIVFDVSESPGQSRNAGKPSSSFEKRPFLFYDYSAIDSGLGTADRSFALVLVCDTAGGWEYLDKQHYKEKKEAVYRIILERLKEVYPGIEEMIDYYEVATPLTMKCYTSNPGGAVYGFAQKPLQAGLFRLLQRPKVDGLYLASAWGYPGGGFTGALWGGYGCALEILRR